MSAVPKYKFIRKRSDIDGEKLAFGILCALFFGGHIFALSALCDRFSETLVIYVASITVAVFFVLESLCFEDKEAPQK